MKVGIGTKTEFPVCQNVKSALRKVPWASSEVKRREIHRPFDPRAPRCSGRGPEPLDAGGAPFFEGFWWNSGFVKVGIGTETEFPVCQNVKSALRKVPWAASEVKRREIHRPFDPRAPRCSGRGHDPTDAGGAPFFKKKNRGIQVSQFAAGFCTFCLQRRRTSSSRSLFVESI